ncbi:MAG: hypothetical protein ABJM43_19015 [Paracoccaceae bacterium]
MESLSDEVKDLFEPRSHLHKARIQAAGILKGNDWTAYNEVKSQFERKRSEAKLRFQQEFQSRISDETSRLIDKAGSVRRRFVPRIFGSDKFYKAAIREQAKLNVQAVHRSEMTQIDKQETKQVRVLVDQAVRIQEKGEKLIQDFQSATDRRVGQERRTRSWNRSR